MRYGVVAVAALVENIIMLERKGHDIRRAARFLIASAAMMACIATAAAGDVARTKPSTATTFRAYRLYTGADNQSHVQVGTVDLGGRAKVEALHFKESAPHASLDWHNDPEPQYVITLSGTLKFETRTGETFVLRPGDVLIAEDHTGSGHKWNLIDDQPWRRAYIVKVSGDKDLFVPDAK